MPAWRARAHHLTRSRVFLAKAAGAILGVSALVAVLLHVSRQHDEPSTGPWRSKTAGAHSIIMLREGARRLDAASNPAPSRLIAWIRQSAFLWAREDPERRSAFDPAALRIGSLELHPLITKHTSSEAQRHAVEAYVRLCFLSNREGRMSALHELQQLAGKGAPPLANEMLGDALMASGRGEAALQAYLSDIAVPEARYARRSALNLANRQRNIEALDLLCSDARVVAEADPGALYNAAKLTGNRRLLLLSLWKIEWARWMQAAVVPLALLAAAIWYIILIHSGSRETLRWVRYLPAVFAGIASVWLRQWWRGTIESYSDPEDAPSMAHELVQWIMHVGLPEEAAKLILFAFFLPVLLHNRSAVKAALTAGCVGLGFALDENLDYFVGSRSLDAIGRLVTANFVHVSLTGILGWHLYELFRSRFHHATNFLTAFCLVVIAHAVYDFSIGGAASQWGMDIAGLIILALCARFYLPLLHDATGPHPGGLHITRTAVFILGTALLSGILMIVTVWEMHSLDGITIVLTQLIGVALVGLIYVREWRELD